MPISVTVTVKMKTFRSFFTPPSVKSLPELPNSRNPSLIPYEVRITEIKEVKYIPPWVQYLAWAGGLFILLLIANISRKTNL